jgi:hypothetical protein
LLPILVGTAVQVALFSGFAVLTGRWLIGFRPAFGATVLAITPPMIGVVTVLVFAALESGLGSATSAVLPLLGIAIVILAAGVAFGVRAPEGTRIGLWPATKLVGAYLVVAFLVVGVLLAAGVVSEGP